MNTPQPPEWTEPVEPVTEPGIPVQPSNAFGPDHSKTTEEIAQEFLNKKPPKVNQKTPPKPGASVFKSLGQNKKPRSGVRALTVKDKEKIASLYTFGAMGLMPFKQNAAMAMARSADACAEAWYEMAQENDGVRRALLMLIEGGAWGKVFAAHTPILIALLPERFMPPMFANFDLNAFLQNEDGQGE
jgi:hypothetical protein